MAIKCPRCGSFNPNEVTKCQRCGQMIGDSQLTQASTGENQNPSDQGRERFWRRLFPKRTKQ